jgi:hypothetical protein
MNSEPTNTEILEAVNNFSTAVDKRFDGIDNRLDSMDNRLDSMDNRLGNMDGRLTAVEATMVTKDYLDEKLADLRGDLVVLVRKEDNKFGALITELLKEKVLSQDAAKRILSMEPFPQN